MNVELSHPREILRKKPGTLEKLFLEISQGKLPSFSGFPPTFSSTQLDPYLNLLSEQTRIDPSSREYGASIYYDTVREKMIYPQNPTPGTYEFASGTTGVSPELPHEKSAVIVNIAHTHPRPTSFSTLEPRDASLGDLGIFAMGYIKEGKKILPASMSVGTAKHNYLLVRSSETLPLEFEEYILAVSVSNRDVESPRWALEEYGRKLFDTLQSTRWNREFLWNNVEKLLGGTYESGWGIFCNRLVDACVLADATKSGFYYSAKDGTYHRLTQKNLKKYIKMRVDEAVDQVKAWALETS